MPNHQVIDFILSRFCHIPTPGQRVAVERMVDFLYDTSDNATFVLRGYAGTGKTSLVSALIQAAPALRIKTVLMAPTGRAAKVLMGYSGQKAYTLHKRIYQTVMGPDGIMHTARALNKHRYTLFVVDEASMIGLADEGGHSSLLDDLVDYVADGDHCRLMLIGDRAQLPPVGAADSPALDVGYLQGALGLAVHWCELTEVVRQGELSGILACATRLRQQVAAMERGEEPQLPLLDIEGHADVVRIDGGGLVETLYREYGEGMEQVAVVTRSNKRANIFNRQIRNRVLYREEELNAGDYLMVVKNNYHWVEPEGEMGFVANGDIGEVLGVRNCQEMYGFHFADVTLRLVDYPDAPSIDCKVLLETLHSESPALTREEGLRLFDAVMADYADLPNKRDRLRAVRQNPYYNALQVKFAYALTCHKTQGGQWHTVIIDQGYFTDDMLDREYLRWLYTAVTRATERVYLLNFQPQLTGAAAE